MINVYLENYGTGAGSWCSLPADEDDIRKLIKEHKISTSENEEYFIADTDINDDLDLSVSEYDNVFHINEVIMEYENLDSYERDVVCAIMEVYGSSIDSLQNAINNVDSYYLVSDIDDEYDLGVYLTEGLFKDKDSIYEDYFDFEKFGRDQIFSGYCDLTSKGCLFQ